MVSREPKISNNGPHAVIEPTIYHIVSNNVWGGGEQYVLDLATSLVEAGRDVQIVCRNRRPLLEHFGTLGITLRTLPLKGFIDLGSAWHLSRLIGKGACIIHVHNFKDAFTAVMARSLARNANARVVMTRHLVKRGKNALLYRILYRQLDRLIFISRLARDEFFSTSPSIDEGKVVIIHNSIKVASPSHENPDLRTIYEIPPQRSVIMYHGRLSHEKGVDVLLQAVSLIDKDKYHLVIAGTGENGYVDSLKHFVAENAMDDNVTFAGFIHDVASYIQQADFGVLPTTAREAFGLANLEYMALGKAHIATCNGAQKEYITSGLTGILVNPSDAEALASAIERLIEDSASRTEIGQKAKEYFDRNLAYPIFFKKICSIYSSVL